MSYYILQFKIWYESLNNRERLFVIFLHWALIYAIATFIFLSPLETRETSLKAEINAENDLIANGHKEIDQLNQLKISPLYKQWMVENKALDELHAKYKYLLQTSPTGQWRDVVKRILHSQKNVSVLQLKNLPETVYSIENANVTAATLYHQPLMLIISSDYFSTIAYLQRLEKLLPNVHWDKLSYQVEKYPLARIEMEFSFLYEKSQ